MPDDEKNVIVIEDTGETLEDFKKELEKEDEIKEENIEELKKEIEDLKDKYLRAVAEIENMKKRFLKEREDARLYGLQDFIKEFLLILDNLKRANQEEKNIEGIKEGLFLIIKQIETILDKYGVKEEPSKEGDSFDPYFQEALSSEKSKGVDKPTIIKIFQRGYFLYDRLIRPTLVHIALPEEGGDDVQNPGN